MVDLARDPQALHDALIDRAAYKALQQELAQALRQIDKGNESVLEKKFKLLSDDVTAWRDLLRPDEMSFFPPSLSAPARAERSISRQDCRRTRTERPSSFVM